MGDQCEAVLGRLEAYLDRECPGDLEAVIAEHLQECPPCLERADFEQRIRRLVASKCREAAPPGLVDRVRSRLQLG